MTDLAARPSEYISAADTALIRDHASAAEGFGQLHPAQLELIYNRRWFKLLVPAIYGGLETPLPDLLRLQEALSWADGSLGWVITLCCGAGWFGGFMEPATAREIFSNPKVCLAGSGAVSGVAEKTKDGYLISGTWNYASGAHHATHFTANCQITENGENVLDMDSKALVLPFVIDAKQVSLLPTWKYIGMVATGSHSFQIKNVLVHSDRQFKIDPFFAKTNGALYQYPFLQLAEATLAVNLSGLAVHFTDLCKEIFAEKVKQPKLTEKQRDLMNNSWQSGTSGLQTARAAVFAAADASWLGGAPFNNDKLSAVSRTSRQLAKISRQVVDELYPYCGLQAASTDSEINRVWRDVHTAGQHSLLTFEN